MADFTVGKYLAARLEQIGLKHYFMVPGDYNLVLLDELLTNENLQQIGCCNELNAAYAAEGYARANGAGAVFTTYNVGAYSALNGVAGAYAERLPVIFVSSGPNTNDPVANHIMHHTMGTHDFSDQYEVCRQVTCEAVRILHPDNAPTLIDQAISTALRERKPVYIEIAVQPVGRAVPRAGADRHVAGFHDAVFPAHQRAGIDRRGRPGQPASGAREEADPAGRGAPALLRRDRRLPGTGRSAGLRGGGHAQRQGLLPRRPPAIRRHLLGRGEHPAVSGHRRLGRPHRGRRTGVLRTTPRSAGARSRPRQRLISAEPRKSCGSPDAEYTGVALADFLSDLAKKVQANAATLTQYHRLHRSSVRPGGGRGRRRPRPR